ncbi:MAG: polysaccharide deacetylase family protein [Methanomassiliicoccaceae archaeon]|nr:polysaccharide deacetylase family protein [Methanomassiliicoccaceae archaeon]
MKRLCFTVDVDRDVNECVPGRKEAVSRRTDGGVRFTSSEEGTDIILDMLDELGIEATFFTEARTLENIDVQFGKNEVAMHGLDHEDMTGEISGIRLSDGDLDEIMGTSSGIIKDHTGRIPKGFRAPYMRTDDRIADAVKRAGMVYDSSLYAEIGKEFGPYVLDNGLKEVPVPFGTDAGGKKIYAYLWPVHEGKRGTDDHARMAGVIENGVLVIATHSWHITESVSGGLMDGARREKNIADTKKIITNILDTGYKAVRIADLF